MKPCIVYVPKGEIQDGNIDLVQNFQPVSLITLFTAAHAEPYNAIGLTIIYLHVYFIALIYNLNDVISMM